MDNPSQKYFGLAGNPNVQNMLELIAKAEGTTEHGHNTAFGGSRFDSLEDHPRYLKPFKQTDGKTNYTSAAGKYQFLSNTWDEVRGKLGLNDFSGPNQDAGAIYLIERAGALPDVMNGDYKAAANKLGKVWASLPSSPYPQPRRSEGFIDSVVKGFLPTAHAGTLPTGGQTVLPQTTGKLSGANMSNETNLNVPERISVNVNNAPVLPAAMAALLGRYPGFASPGGELRSQDVNSIAPEAMQSIQNMRETKAKMLPLALGALMSSNSGANAFGQSIAGPAMSALDPLKLQNGMITPDGQYITDVDNAAYMRHLAAMNKGQDGKTISAGELSKYNDKLGIFAQLDSLSKDFKAEYTTSLPFEAVGDAQNWLGKKTGVGFEKQANFWMGYQETVNKIRNEMFGSALTEPERREFEKAIVRPGMTADTIQSNLNKQASIIKNALERQSLIFKESGYDTRGMDAGLNRAKNVQVSNVPDSGGGGKPSAGGAPASGGAQPSMKELLKLYGG